MEKKRRWNQRYAKHFETDLEGMSMGSAKRWMGVALALVLATVFALPTQAATETVDGVTWIYSVTGSGAEVTGANPAEGDLVIPSSLGPYTVTGIGDFAFNDCRGLTTVTIGEGVRRIGNCAFNGCSGLVAVNIHDLKAWCEIDFGEVNANPLYYARHLYLDGEEVTGDLMIPDDTKTIGEYAFYFCTNLTSVTIPDGVTHIGKGAFRNCNGLTSVTIGKGVTSMGNYAFSGCNRLTGIAVDTHNPSYASLDGVLFSRDMTALLVFPCGKQGVYSIPDSVTNIDDYAFYWCSGLVDVTISDSVTSIGNYAFYGCDGLTDVRIGNGVTSIGDYAFYWCSGLKSVTIPASVARIGNSAFSSCSGLMEFAVRQDNPSYASLDGVLFSRDMTTLMLFPCRKQGAYDIPPGVTNIADSAFYGCSGLENVTIPATVTSIGNSAFYRCNGLANMTIPASVTNIGYGVFSGCSGLASVTIGDGVMSIGNTAFYGCSGLAIVTIPASVTNIGYSAFHGCSGLKEFFVDAQNPSYSSLEGVLFSRDKTTLVAFPGGKQGGYDIPNSVTRIEHHAFYQCNALTDITIPTSVSVIGSSSFYECNGLTRVTIEEGVTRIENYAFSRCSELASVEIPSSVASIGNFAFSGCSRLAAFEVADGNTAYASRDGVLFSKDMETLVCCPGGKAGVLVVPDSVKSIGPYALSWCGKLKNIIAPASLQFIGDYAFFSCNGLETLFMPMSWKGKSLDSARIRPGCRIVYGTRGTESVDGATWQYFIEDGSAMVIAADVSGVVSIPGEFGGCPVTDIVPFAFSGCEGLTGVVIPAGVTNIGHHAFCGCEGLARVEIPSDVIEIGDYAFSGCKGLTNVVIPDTVQRIGIYAFHDCRMLTGLTIGSGVVDIGRYAFAKCRRLTSVIIPGSVKTIGDYAFYRTGLTDLVLPNGVEDIGSLAFSDCDRLTAVKIPGSVAELGDNPFARCNELLEIVVAPDNGLFASQDGVLYSKDKTALLGVPAGREGVFAIPDGVTNVGSHAFGECVGVTALEVGEGNVNYASQDGALFSKDMTRLLVCPAGKIGSFVVPDGVVHIKDRAFDDCETLTRILIPDSVATLGLNSLSRCHGLVALFVPTAWKDAWQGNTIMKGAKMQVGWKTIYGTLEAEVVDGVEWHCFAEDGGSVLLPGDYGTEVEIPGVLGGRPVTRIGDYAFYGCGDLKSVVIPESVTNVGDYAFYGCEGLGGVTLPESVRSIGKWAFGGCKGLKNVELPEGVERIGDRAFFGCSGLPEAAVPDSVASIGVNAFFGNSELTVLEVGTNNANYASQDGVLFSKDMEKLLWCPDGKTGEYAIPGTVKTIATRAFGDCVGLTAGTVPESVEKIGRNSFYGCRGLAVLYVPASWEGVPGWLDMLARAKLSPECQIIYLKDDPVETTSTTPVPVPFAWLEEKAGGILEENGWDYETAASATASNGVAVWECYLAGLVPTNAGAVFTAKLEFVDGQPVVKWDPDLNEGATKAERAYRVWARKAVEAPEATEEGTREGWRDVTGQEASWVTNGWRFFKVGVEMPE